MSDIKKEEFAFGLYSQLQDEFNMVDKHGDLARKIQQANGTTLDNIIRILQGELQRNILAAASAQSEGQLS